MSESDAAGQPAEREDSAPSRSPSRALLAVQVSLDRRDNGGDGALLAK